MRMRVLLLALVIGLLTALPAHAWWGKDKKEQDTAKPPASESKPVKRSYHLSIPDKATEKELMGLFRARRLLGEDIRVLGRLTEDRKNRFGSLQKSLREEFSILPEIRYEYDRDKMIVYKLVSEPGRPASDKTNAGTQPDKSIKKGQGPKKRSMHMKLKNEEQARRFLSLIASKMRAGQEIRVFQSGQREQQNKLKKVNDLLGKKFSLKSGRFYDYDEKTMKLYEIIPPNQQSPRK